MLVLHHLSVSQSERVAWLLEELEIPYKLVRHIRDPISSPESLKSLDGNATGKAPFLEDPEENITLSESGAICEYIIHKHGGGRFAAKPSDKNYAKYLRFLHFANGTLQNGMSVGMFLAATGVSPDAQMTKIANGRLRMSLQILNDRLADNKWLAGEFSAADIMTLYSTSTARYWGPQINLGEYEHLLRWMKDCSERPAYQRAMEKGDPEMKLLLTAQAPSISMLAAGGVSSSHWKK